MRKISSPELFLQNHFRLCEVRRQMENSSELEIRSKYFAHEKNADGGTR